MPQALPERQGAGHQQERWRENREQTHQAAQPTRRRGLHGGAEEGGKGEQGARHRLRRAISSQKGILVDPTGGHDLGLQQGQHDVATAKHQGPGAEEGIHPGQGLAGQQLSHNRKAGQQAKKQAQPDDTRTVAHRYRQGIVIDAGSDLAQHQPGQSGHDEDADLSPRRRLQQNDASRQPHQRHALHIRAQTAGHAPDRLGDDRDRYHLQAMQHPRRDGIAMAGNAERKQDQSNRRRQRKARPGSQRSGVAGPGQPQRHADLAAGRPRQELTQRHQIGVAALGHPLPSRDEFLAKVAQMGDRPAKGG